MNDSDYRNEKLFTIQPLPESATIRVKEVKLTWQVNPGYKVESVEFSYDVFECMNLIKLSDRMIKTLLASTEYKEAMEKNESYYRENAHIDIQTRLSVCLAFPGESYENESESTWFNRESRIPVSLLQDVDTSKVITRQVASIMAEMKEPDSINNVWLQSEKSRIYWRFWHVENEAYEANKAFDLARSQGESNEES